MRYFAQCLPVPGPECMESMLDDDTCDPGCNVVECGHDRGDCGATSPTWLSKLGRTHASLAAAPPGSAGSAVPLSMRLKLMPITVLIDADTGETYARFQLRLAMAWGDARWACSLVACPVA